jgi:hypothetical protein
MPAPTKPDITVVNHGSIIGFTPGTDDGETWLTEHLPDDVQCLGRTRFCEPRYAGDIVDGAESDGLTVA